MSNLAQSSFEKECRYILNSNDLLGYFDNHIGPMIEKEAETFSAYDELISKIKALKSSNADEKTMKKELIDAFKVYFDFTPSELVDKFIS